MLVAVVGFVAVAVVVVAGSLAADEIVLKRLLHIIYKLNGLFGLSCVLSLSSLLSNWQQIPFQLELNI